MSLTSLFLGILLPQLSGVAVLGLLRRHVFAAVLLAPLVSALLFMIPTAHGFGVAADEIAAGGDGPCGAFGAMALFVTLGGGFLHLGVSAVTVWLVAWARLSPSS